MLSDMDSVLAILLHHFQRQSLTLLLISAKGLGKFFTAWFCVYTGFIYLYIVHIR
jgi:hypothetical protein